jgi:hypothetical protein
MSTQVAEPVTSFRPVSGPEVWTADEMHRRSDWLYHLTEADIAELDAACAAFQASGAGLLQISRDNFPLNDVGATLQRIRHDILHGRGFVQMRGLPVRHYTRAEAATIYMGIGAHLGDAMASQNDKGHVLGHIFNIGESKANPNQRGPYSKESLPYHTDACDIVGLLCLATAKSGGESSLVSSGQMFNELLATRPDLVEPLTQPVHRDRRGEIPPGKAPWYAIPVFNLHDGLLSVSIEPTYTASVHRHFESDPVTPEQHAGIAAVQKLAHVGRLDIAFEPGDMQFLNNFTVMHSRQAFEDHVGDARRRHLLRLWLLCDDARDVPDPYWDRHGSRASLRRPGGIVGPDTVLNCPLDPA